MWATRNCLKVHSSPLIRSTWLHIMFKENRQCKWAGLISSLLVQHAIGRPFCRITEKRLALISWKAGQTVFGNSVQRWAKRWTCCILLSNNQAVPGWNFMQTLAPLLAHLCTPVQSGRPLTLRGKNSIVIVVCLPRLSSGIPRAWRKPPTSTSSREVTPHSTDDSEGPPSKIFSLSSNTLWVLSWHNSHLGTL